MTAMTGGRAAVAVGTTTLAGNCGTTPISGRVAPTIGPQARVLGGMPLGGDAISAVADTARLFGCIARTFAT